MPATPGTEDRVPYDVATDYPDDREANGVNLSNRIYDTNPQFRDAPSTKTGDALAIQSAILAIVIELRRQNDTLERIADRLQRIDSNIEWSVNNR